MQHDVSYEAEQGPSQRRSSEHRSVPRNERFIPVTSPVLIDGLIFACSVLHCIVGSLLVIIGVISLPIVPHFTSSIALPIYPGSIAILAGVIGCIWRRNKSKCLIGAVLAVSITAFILSITTIVLYSFAYSHFDNLRDKSLSDRHKQWCFGLIMLILLVTACEHILSSATIILSLGAGWKFNWILFSGCCKFDTTEDNDGSIGTIELKHSDTKDDHSETQNGELIEEMGINVINETPRRRNLFPFLLNHSLILKFSVVKCANGSFLNIIALINISIIGIYGSNFALPLWYGMLVLINGTVGLLLRQNANKCMVGGFCALSISSLVASVAAISFYTKTWVDVNLSHYRNSTSVNKKDRMIVLVLCLVIVDFISSLSSVVLSCEAYWKFCSTCNVADCFTCLGCCECDTTPLYEKPEKGQKKARRSKNTVAPIWEESGRQGIKCTPMVNSSHGHIGQDKDLQETAIQSLPALVNIFVGDSAVSRSDVVPNTGENNFTKNSFGHEEFIRARRGAP